MNVDKGTLYFVGNSLAVKLLPSLSHLASLAWLAPSARRKRTDTAVGRVERLIQVESFGNSDLQIECLAGGASPLFRTR